MELSRIVKSLALGMPALIKGGQPGYRAGDEQLALRILAPPAGLTVLSDTFVTGWPLPATAGADFGNKSPPLRWTSVPEQARSLALIVEDPDAPTVKPFVHWLIWNIDTSVTELKTGARFAVEGRNSTLRKGFAGAAPPRGDRPHRYHFQLFALDRLLELPAGTGRGKLLAAMRGHVLASGELVGTYAR